MCAAAEKGRWTKWAGRPALAVEIALLAVSMAIHMNWLRISDSWVRSAVWSLLLLLWLVVRLWRRKAAAR